MIATLTRNTVPAAVWLFGGLAAAMHGAVAGALLLAGDAPARPKGIEHVFQVVSLPVRPAVAPPSAAPLPPPEPPPEPEPVVEEVPPPPAAEPPPAPLPQAAVEPRPSEPRPRPVPRRKPKPPQVQTRPQPLAPPLPPPVAVASRTAPEAPVAPAPVEQGVPDEFVGPDLTAAYLHNPPPHYPVRARRRGIEGVVLLEVALDAGGRPVSVAVKRGSGHPGLDEAALMAVRQWKFTPAKRGGRAAAATVEVPIRFSLNGRG